MQMLQQEFQTGIQLISNCSLNQNLRCGRVVSCIYCDKCEMIRKRDRVRVTKRERVRKRENECVCVTIREREREREKQ